MKKKRPKPATVNFEHKRIKEHHEPSGSVTYLETRGAREASTVFLFEDFEETLSMPNHQGHTAADTYASFFEASGHWLREVGEKTFFEVVDDVEKVKAELPPEERTGEVDRFIFQKWAFEVGMKHGFLSPAAIAAEFVSSSDYLHRLVDGNEELQRAIYQFAEAWHWFRFEGKGEHELAAIGLQSARARMMGPQVRREMGDLRKKIVLSAYEAFAADEKNRTSRGSAKAAAGVLLTEINRKLTELNRKPIAIKTLTDELRPIIEERFPKKKKGSAPGSPSEKG
ncbi:hypothetical protein CQ12_11535 [Bradyrhizobium jicamae]|uniref:Uncharacterized protein n=1 Tax=Bradyrhizobium jicamae TaxID=280332 RepID=A0A0R3LLB7_9BRAD|nr:hypothetical protein [Bradyrhizobium jicamae]KRR06211.1 hypothetical protein CQ12_11535 [Bradyrhizobium jicamae]